MDDLPTTIDGILGGPPMRLRCPIPTVWTQRSGRPFGVYWSDEYELGQLHPLPSDEELTRFYEVYYERKRETEAASPSRSRFTLPSLLNRVAGHLDRSRDVTGAEVHDLLGRRPSSVVELGCGAGELLAEIADHGHRVLGLEPSPSARRAAQERGLTVYGGIAEELPDELERGVHDLVLIQHTLEHCRDPIRALENAHDLLRPGGLLICEVPNHGSAGFSSSEGAWFHTDAGRHLYFFTEKSLGEALRRAGLAPISFHYAGFARQFDESWLEAEREVWDALYGDDGKARGDTPVPPRPSTARTLRLFASTILADPSTQHDSLRVHARRLPPA